MIFLIGSALCGLAQGMTELIAFRAIQGLGGGGLMVSAQAAIGDVVSAARARALHGPVRRGVRRRERRRAADRRLPHHAPVVALDLLRQPAARRRRARRAGGRRCRRPAERAPARDRLRWARSLLAVGAQRRSSCSRRSAARSTTGARRRSSALGVVGVACLVAFVLRRAARGRADPAAAPVPQPRLRGHERGRASWSASRCSARSPTCRCSSRSCAGCRPTASGLQLLPVMGGLLIASIGSGQVITAHRPLQGRSRSPARRSPAVGMFLLSR